MKMKMLRLLATIVLILAATMTSGVSKNSGPFVAEANEEDCHGCLGDYHCAEYYPYTKCKTGSCSAWAKKCSLP